MILQLYSKKIVRVVGEDGGWELVYYLHLLTKGAEFDIV